MGGCLFSRNIHNLGHKVSTSISQIPCSMRNITRPALKYRCHHANTLPEFADDPLFLLFPELCILFAQNSELHLVPQQAKLGISVLTHKRFDYPYRLVGP